MPAVLVGRDAELASLRDFVSGAAEGARMLVLEGEAGMGKTTLWSAGVVHAEDAGHLVLQARPSEGEAELSFAGLGDLVNGVLDDVLGSLQPPQRRALSRALLLDDDEGRPPDPHAIGVAVQSALRTLAAARPTIVAIDDVQWFDPASAGALSYACRRCSAERVGILLTRRSGLASSLVDEVRRSLAADEVALVEVGPLDAGALHRLIQEQLGATLPRPLLAEVHQAAGGNPFYALEIVRTLRRSGISIEAGQPIPVPDSLHDLVHGRLLALPPESRDFLLAAAAHAHPTLSITEAASGVPCGDGLTPALDARIVELEGERIRFTHPLLAAGAYEAGDPLRRLEIHARLADALEDPEARAWQLAASVEQPDEDVAAALETAAWVARARGAPRPAALLLERASELTVGDHDVEARRRAIDAAYLHYESGDSTRAEAKLRTIVSELPPSWIRARGLVRLARVRSYEAQAEAADLFLRAVEEGAGDPKILAVAHEGVANCFVRMHERLSDAVEHAKLAAKLGFELDDDALAGEALGTQLLAETLLGWEDARRTVDQAMALQGTATATRVLRQPLPNVAARWRWTDDVQEALRVSLEMLERTQELGDESSRPLLLMWVGEVECSLGQLESALNRSLEGQMLSEQSGQRTLLANHLALQCLVCAQLGRIESARDSARTALELLPVTGARHAELLVTQGLANLALALGDPEGALASTASFLAFVQREAIVEPGFLVFVVDRVEALTELGRTEEAVDLLDWYEGNARRLERASALASCARCRGLLAAQAGSVDEAIAAYREALRWHESVELPIDLGRTLLALGVAQRRMKQRSEARKTLEEALAIFERIGAALWAERARAELKRISGRAATPGALTPAEERVATLVAEGKTNREVAAALFLSDRTVEGHLTHVFGKLGIKHRSEVGPALASRQIQGVAASNTGDSPVSAESLAP